MNLTILFFVLVGIGAVVVLWFVMTYNRFIRLRTLLKEAWSGIDVQLKRRYDLIPNLVSTVKGYSVHEKSIFEDIAKYRAASMGATDMGQKSEAEVGLTGALKTLFAVAENYPDLKANANFLELQGKLAVLEEDIQLARRYYNGTVRNYNVLCTIFPSNIIASLASFKEAEFFEVSNSEERDTPNVKFD
ncbi:LemA family protein [bacterium]|jgi:LemA protein|nr:LemA family protein [bacterium]MBT5015345.1 LemA family protein [bacterium]